MCLEPVVTCRNLYGSLSYGQVQLFKRTGEGTSTSWSRVWTFPDPEVDYEEPYLNAPHQGPILPSVAGGFELVYAHSNGLASSWGNEAAGTFGTAILPDIESPPDYVAEETLLNVAGHALGYVKSVEILPDGNRLLADYGAFPPATPAPSALYVVSPRGRFENAGKAGYWRPDHSQQNIYDVSSSVRGYWSCAWGGLYEALWIDPADFGQFLRKASFVGGARCPGPLPPDNSLLDQ